MDEINAIPPSELKSALMDIYAGPEPDSSFASHLDLELRRHHSKTPDPPKDNKSSFMKSLRARPPLALLLAIIALLLLSGAAYAIGRLAGFIPGFGFTSGAAYVLNVPVEVSQNDVKVRVEKAVQDSAGLWVDLSVQGMPEGDGYTPGYVLSQTGEKVQSERGGGISSEAGVLLLTYVFPALDDPSQPTTLILENLGGQTFQMTFTLRSARTNEVLPVLSGSILPVKGEMRDYMALVLENVAMSADRTVLQVSLHFDQPGVSLAAPWNVTMRDNQGRIYPLVDITPEITDIGVTRLYQTVPLQGNEQLILNLVSFPPDSDLQMLMDFSTNAAAFTFDPGRNPHIGQTWPLNEILQAGQFSVHLVSARMASPTELIFEFGPTKNVTGLMLYSTLASGASGGGPVQNTNFTAGMTFAKIPSVPFEIELGRIYYTASGPWQVEWQVPVASALKFPTMTPAPSPTPLAVPSLTSQDPLLLEVLALSQKFDHSIVQGPGWIHVVNENITEHMAAGQTYPPPYYQDEQWYEIDSEGWVTRNVTTHRDVDGNIIQQSASIGTKGINFTSGDVFENSPYRLSFDFLIRDLDSALLNGQPILREDVTCDDGSGCLLITVMDQFAQPIQNPGQPIDFYGHGLRVWIHVETGQQVKIQSFWTLADGTEQVDYTQRALLVEKVLTPSGGVLETLDSIVMPQDPKVR